MSVDGRHAHDRLARAHFADQQQGLLAPKGLAGGFDDVGLGVERIAQQVELRQRITARHMQWIQRSFCLLAEQRPVGQQVLVQVLDAIVLDAPRSTLAASDRRCAGDPSGCPR